MKNVIITGSTGMVGGLALEACLKRNDVKQVTSIVRKKSGFKHDKLVEIVHDDFLDFSSISQHLEGQDVCLFCIGVYTGAVPKDEFRKITVDYTKAFAEALKQNSEKSTFCFLSGQGADSTEKSRMMFARDKGVAENLLKGLGFDQAYLFRPGYIFPTISRKEPNFSYRLFRWLYKPILSKLGTNLSVTSEHLALVMVDVGISGGKKEVYENRDIMEHPVKK